MDHRKINVKNTFFAILISCSATLSHGQTGDSPSPYRVVSIGDSITRAFNAKGLFDSPELSWSTGDRVQDINSHLGRIRAALGLPATGNNVAKTGAKADDLARQVDLALELNPDYVTMLVGANDVCRWSDDPTEEIEEFSNHVRSAIMNLVSSNSAIKILLSPIPDMLRLYEVGSNSPVCRSRWKRFGICPRLLDSSRTDDERAAFGDRLREANVVLQGIADEFADHVHFAASVATYQFESRDVSSIDCFHPSLIGQQKISDLTWDESWPLFPKPWSADISETD